MEKTELLQPKKVAMALAELITKKYKKDTLDIIVFGNDAWQIQIKDLALSGKLVPITPIP